tara:strand:+ start:3043 stop:3321 length:279 start_codon:yes stop_codon:yes gene_type:complete
MTLDLHEIERRHERAKGWHEESVRREPERDLYTHEHVTQGTYRTSGVYSQGDDYVAEALADIPTLIARVRALEADREALVPLVGRALPQRRA